MDLKELLVCFRGNQERYQKQSSPTKQMKALNSFRSTFKRAFEEEKARHDAPVQIAEPGSQTDAGPSTRERSLHESDVICIGYSGIAVVSNTPPQLLKILETLPAIEASGLASESKTDSHVNKVDSLSLPDTHVVSKNADLTSIPTTIEAADDKRHSSSRVCGTTVSTIPVSSSNPELRSLAGEQNTARSSSSGHRLRRSKSQKHLAGPEGRPPKVRPVISRRSSISDFESNLDFSSVSINSHTIQKSLEDGMLKLSRRAKVIDLARSQRVIDEALSRSSTVVPTDERHVDADQLQLVQIGALKSKDLELKVQHDKELAAKDEIISQILSRYQALYAEHKELMDRSAESSTHSLGSKLSTTQKCVQHLRNELADAERKIREQESQLFQAYTVACSTDQQLTAARDTNSQQSLELQRALHEIARLQQRLSSATNDLTDIKFECGRVTYKNFLLREATESDPGKTAGMDNTVEFLKKDLLHAEDRAIQAEELNIQLRKREEEEKSIKEAEMTALISQNSVLKEAAHGLLASKQLNQRAVDSILEQIQGNLTEASLKAALEAYCFTVKENEQLDKHIFELAQMHSAAVEKAKSLQISHDNLEATAKDDQARYLELEAESKKYSDTVDMLQIEADHKAQEFEQALQKKDAEVDSVKKVAANYLQILEHLAQSTADACTSWFFQYKDTAVAKAKAASEKWETTAKNLQQELNTMKWFQADATLFQNQHLETFSQYPQQLTDCEEEKKKLRDRLAEHEAQLSPQNFLPQHPDSLAATQKIIKDLEKKLEQYDFKFSSQDYIKWEDHVSHLDHIRRETAIQVETRVCKTMKATIEKDLLVQIGEEFVQPLIELGGHFWERIGRLEYVLSHHLRCSMEDDQRQALIKASKQFQINVSRGIYPPRSN